MWNGRRRVIQLKVFEAKVFEVKGIRSKGIRSEVSGQRYSKQKSVCALHFVIIKMPLTSFIYWWMREFKNKITNFHTCPVTAHAPDLAAFNCCTCAFYSGIWPLASAACTSEVALPVHVRGMYIILCVLSPYACLAHPD